MLVLGIHAGHNATAAPLKDGKAVSCVSEERFSRVKNQIGFPGMAIRAVLESNHAGIGDVDLQPIPSNVFFAGLFLEAILWRLSI